MAPWSPPIPSGKLYSEPALKLGPALAMLLWCYDGVQQGGTVEVSLEKAAKGIGKPYRTIKEWWHLLREGPFFSELKDCGHKGWLVRMADDWLDWRVMVNNYPEGQQSALETPPSSPDKGQSTALETAQGPLKARSRPDEGQKVALEEPAYKVLHNDQKTPKDPRTDRAPPSDHQKLMGLYAEALPDNRIPNGKQEGQAAKAILQAGYTPEEAMRVYQYLKRRDFWVDQHLSLQSVNKNMGAVLAALKRDANGPRGNQTQGGSVVRNGYRPANADLPSGPVSSGQAELERQYREWAEGDDDSEFVFKNAKL